MSKIRRLELTDRSIIEAYFRRYKPEISEFTFTNLFVWRVARPLFIAEAEGSMVLEALRRGRLPSAPSFA